MIGIHSDKYDNNAHFVSRYVKILEFNNIEYCILDISQADFWNKVNNLDIFIFRWHHTDYHHQIAKSILPIIQNEIGVKCFPDLKTCWHFDDKISQFYLMKHYNYPYTRSWIFWDKELALQWVLTAEYPIVFKLKGGAGSTNVSLIRTVTEAISAVNKMFSTGLKSGGFSFFSSARWNDFNISSEIRKLSRLGIQKLKSECDYSSSSNVHKNYILFQEFLPNNKYDTRVTIIGDRAFAFRRFNRDNDFRSSGSGKISYDLSAIDLDFIKKAFQISKKLGFQSMAYDFLYGKEGEAQFCEISYTYSDGAIYNCSGYWDSSLVWHEGHYWPEYCHLMDLLRTQNLNQPDYNVMK